MGGEMGRERKRELGRGRGRGRRGGRVRDFTSSAFLRSAFWLSLSAFFPAVFYVFPHGQQKWMQWQTQGQAPVAFSSSR